MKRTYTTQTFTLDNGEEVELTYKHNAVDWTEPTIKQAGDRIIFGYLVHDQDCENPLESSDGMGHIYHHPRSSYGSGNSDYYAALGLNKDGNLIVDDDQVQKLWRSRIMALPLTLFHIADNGVRDLIRKRDGEGAANKGRYSRVIMCAILRERLANEQAGDHSMWLMCIKAWRYRFKIPYETIASISDVLDDHVDWSWPEIVMTCAKPADPNAVLLDLYKHGGVKFSIAGAGMQDRFDISRRAAVWVPDQCLRDELVKIDDSAARRAQAMIRAEQALDEYNAWVNGECYGVVVQTHDLSGTLIESDSCWGFIGEAAEEALDEMLDESVAGATSAAQRK